MRAVRSTEEGIRLAEVPEPEGPGVGVAIRATSICGSDLSLIQAGPLPVTLGHEFAGVLDDGRAVAIEPIKACGTCDQCRQDDYRRCRLGPQTFLGIGCDGGMAERVMVPERCLVPLPDGLPVSDASLVEPLAVTLHGLRLGGARDGQRVAVVGAGSIGLLCVAGARSLGCDVGLVARHPAQIEAGERLGAKEAEGEYDLVVDCAGSESGLARAGELSAPGATLVLLGAYWGQVPLPGVAVMLKEIHVAPSITYNRHAGERDVDAAAELLASDPEIAATLITHRFPLNEAPEAFRVAEDRKSGSIKVVLEP